MRGGTEADLVEGAKGEKRAEMQITWVIERYTYIHKFLHFMLL